MQCPRCSYVQTASETKPTDQCPNCGIYYAKFTLPPLVGSMPAKASGALTGWILPALIAGAIGFFAGREQVKYQLRQSLATAFAPQAPATPAPEFSVKGLTLGMPRSSVDSVLNLGKAHCVAAGCAWTNASYGNQSATLIVSELNGIVCGINIRFENAKLAAIAYGLEEKYGAAQKSNNLGQTSYFWLQGKNRLEVSDKYEGILLFDTACIEGMNERTRAAEAIRE